MMIIQLPLPISTIQFQGQTKISHLRGFKLSIKDEKITIEKNQESYILVQQMEVQKSQILDHFKIAELQEKTVNEVQFINNNNAWILFQTNLDKETCSLLIDETFKIQKVIINEYKNHIGLQNNELEQKSEIESIKECKILQNEELKKFSGSNLLKVNEVSLITGNQQGKEIELLL